MLSGFYIKPSAQSQTRYLRVQIRAVTERAEKRGPRGPRRKGGGRDDGREPRPVPAPRDGSHRPARALRVEPHEDRCRLAALELALRVEPSRGALTGDGAPRRRPSASRSGQTGRLPRRPGSRRGPRPRPGSRTCARASSPAARGSYCPRGQRCRSRIPSCTRAERTRQRPGRRTRPSGSRRRRRAR